MDSKQKQSKYYSTVSSIYTNNDSSSGEPFNRNCLVIKPSRASSKHHTKHFLSGTPGKAYNHGQFDLTPHSEYSTKRSFSPTCLQKMQAPVRAKNKNRVCLGDILRNTLVGPWGFHIQLPLLDMVIGRFCPCREEYKAVQDSVTLETSCKAEQTSRCIRGSRLNVTESLANDIVLVLKWLGMGLININLKKIEKDFCDDSMFEVTVTSCVANFSSDSSHKTRSDMDDVTLTSKKDSNDVGSSKSNSPLLNQDNSLPSVFPLMIGCGKNNDRSLRSKHKIPSTVSLKTPIMRKKQRLIHGCLNKVTTAPNLGQHTRMYGQAIVGRTRNDLKHSEAFKSDHNIEQRASQKNVFLTETGSTDAIAKLQTLYKNCFKPSFTELQKMANELLKTLSEFVLSLESTDTKFYSKRSLALLCQLFCSQIPKPSSQTMNKILEHADIYSVNNKSLSFVQKNCKLKFLLSPPLDDNVPREPIEVLNVMRKLLLSHRCMSSKFRHNLSMEINDVSNLSASSAMQGEASSTLALLLNRLWQYQQTPLTLTKLISSRNQEHNNLLEVKNQEQLFQSLWTHRFFSNASSNLRELGRILLTYSHPNYDLVLNCNVNSNNFSHQSQQYKNYHPCGDGNVSFIPPHICIQRIEQQLSLYSDAEEANSEKRSYLKKKEMVPIFFDIIYENHKSACLPKEQEAIFLQEYLWNDYIKRIKLLSCASDKVLDHILSSFALLESILLGRSSLAVPFGLHGFRPSVWVRHTYGESFKSNYIPKLCRSTKEPLYPIDTAQCERDKIITKHDEETENSSNADSNSYETNNKIMSQHHFKCVNQLYCEGDSLNTTTASSTTSSSSETCREFSNRKQTRTPFSKLDVISSKTDTLSGKQPLDYTKVMGTPVFSSGIEGSRIRLVPFELCCCWDLLSFKETANVLSLIIQYLQKGLIVPTTLDRLDALLPNILETPKFICPLSNTPLMADSNVDVRNEAHAQEIRKNRVILLHLIKIVETLKTKSSLQLTTVTRHHLDTLSSLLSSSTTPQQTKDIDWMSPRIQAVVEHLFQTTNINSKFFNAHLVSPVDSSICKRCTSSFNIAA